MGLKNWKPLLLLVLAIALVVVAEVVTPRPLDWRVTLTARDKIPFGAHALRDLLPALFPGQPIYDQNLSLFEHLGIPDAEDDEEPEDSTALAPENYLILSPTFDPGEADVEALLAWINAGNDAFIASGSFGGPLADTLHLETDFSYQPLGNGTRVSLVNPALRAPGGYALAHVTAGLYFSRFDTLRSTVLGVDSLGRPNFIRTDVGRGHLFLHALPAAFSNYHLLYQRNHAYQAACLSYLPVRPLRWDEHYKPGRTEQESQSPVRFLVSHPALRGALYLTLASLLLFVVFEAKRRQRIIPVIPPLANTSLEFAQTIGRLYYQHRDHKNIADKKITYLLEYIRRQYRLATTDRDADFYQTLSQKSGVAPREVAALFALIDQAQRQPILAEPDLLHLHAKIDHFYVQTQPTAPVTSLP